MLPMGESAGISLLRSANLLLSVWAWRRQSLTTRDMRRLRNTLTSYTGMSTQLPDTMVMATDDTFPPDCGNAHGRTAPRYGARNRRPHMIPLKSIASNLRANTTNSQVMGKRIPRHNAHQHSSKLVPPKPESPLQESMPRVYTAASLRYRASSHIASL